MFNTGIYSTKFQQKKKAEYDRKPPHEGSLGLIRAIQAVVSKDQSLIDLGAGMGRHVKMLREQGYENVIGVDGTPGVYRITEGLVSEINLLGLKGHFTRNRYSARALNWGLFYDVGEHVPREFEQKLIDNICDVPQKGLIISWGSPGERGKDHVNLRTQVYVACEFAKRGWMPSDELTQKARDVSKFNHHYVRLFVALKQK